MTLFFIKKHPSICFGPLWPKIGLSARSGTNCGERKRRRTEGVFLRLLFYNFIYFIRTHTSTYTIAITNPGNNLTQRVLLWFLNFRFLSVSADFRRKTEATVLFSALVVLFWTVDQFSSHLHLQHIYHHDAADHMVGLWLLRLEIWVFGATRMKLATRCRW